jgi:hypothetical protein
MALCRVILLAALTAIGCSRSDNGSAPVPETPTLPSFFPSPIPVYPHTRLTAVKSVYNDAGRRVSLAVLETKDPVSTVSEFYDQGTKFFARNNVETTPTSHLLSLTENDRKFDLFVNITRSGDTTTIHIEAAAW